MNPVWEGDRKDDMEERLRQQVLDHLVDGKLGCPEAHAIAQAMGTDPLAVGRAADAAGVRIARCQLGLFGFGSKVDGTHKIVRPMEQVPSQLEAALHREATAEGLPCTAVWAVADRLGYSRLQASSAAEALGLRVSRCQLGCFPRPRKGL